MVPKEVTVEQESIEIAGSRLIITRIPTATAGSWFVVHDACEIWAAVAIEDFSGEVLGWRNPPERYKAEIETAIKTAFGITAE